ncbi:MAG: NDP-sugar synthase [Chlorobiaceae bacterium]|nr:NDP-sugar synthase [Chlorobiaceae bacterium]NTV60834.1 NDP-sugar synthase [Chlorobiaceae bacterium]
MKTLIVIREKDYGWMSSFFPGVHPLVVPICNKPFIEFLLDFAILAGSTAVRIVSDGSLNSVEAYCETGDRWGIELGYGSIRQNDSDETVMEKNRLFCSEDRVLVINGFIFIRYADKAGLKSFFAETSSGSLSRCSSGSIELTGIPEDVSAAPGTLPFSLTDLHSIDSYYRLNAEILTDYPSPYVLPGYSNEPDCHMGRNVVISKGAEVIKPVVIGNNVQIMKGAIVGPSAVIGSNVIVDRESTVSRSIVLDNTYIGEQLDIVGRIASGNTLVDPETAFLVSMEDPHLLAGMNKAARRQGLVLIRYLAHAAIALLLILLLILPYLFFRILLSVTAKWQTRAVTFYGANEGKSFTSALPSISCGGTTCSLFTRLSLDRFPMFFHVLAGKIGVIGSFPLEVKESGHGETEIFSGYRPAVFSYAEAEDWPADAGESAIVERYYAVHGTPAQDIVLTVKAFLNRMHPGEQE